MSVEADPDAELMMRVASGDKGAFATLFDKYQASVCNFAYRFVGSRAQAEELAQDIFVKVYKTSASYRPNAKFKTFLFRVATNHCLNEVRRGTVRTDMNQPTEPSPRELAGPTTNGPDQALEGKELELAVGRALDGMSERERAAFTMCRFEGMAYRDIAAALSASEAAVKSLIHRATLAVTRRLEELRAGTAPMRSGA